MVFDIETMGFAGDGPLYEPRRLVITTTELFDLAEALDDICDAIEDNDTELAKNSRSKQVL